MVNSPASRPNQKPKIKNRFRFSSIINLSPVPRRSRSTTSVLPFKNEMNNQIIKTVQCVACPCCGAITRAELSLLLSFFTKERRREMVNGQWRIVNPRPSRHNFKLKTLNFKPNPPS
jgi:hypothetical protein